MRLFLRFSNTVMTYVLKTCTYEMYFRYSKNKSLNIPVASTSFGPPDWAYQTNSASLQKSAKSALHQPYQLQPQKDLRVQKRAGREAEGRE